MGEEKRNRIDDALSMCAMKQTELAELTGIHKATISNWINQKYQPKQKSLIKMAAVLGVSELWLAGYDVPMERPVNNNDNINKLKADKRCLDIALKLISLKDNQLDLVENIVSQLEASNG